MDATSRRFPPLNAPDRDMLTMFLEYQRDTLEWKCTGLLGEQLKGAAVLPSPMTLLGLLRHMTVVEYHWFERVLTGSTKHRDMYRSQTSPDADWNDLESCSIEEVFDRWKASCEESRENARAHPGLDTPAALPWDEQPVTLRWITTHMIEEYARHIGHADLLRERIDGATGE